MRHLLPDGQIATRTTQNPYTHVVCGVWSEARLHSLRERARKGVDQLSGATLPRDVKKLSRYRDELSTYLAMQPGGHYVVCWVTSAEEAERKRRLSQRHVQDELYVAKIVTPR